jgi:hypothetical protein
MKKKGQYVIEVVRAVGREGCLCYCRGDKVNESIVLESRDRI